MFQPQQLAVVDTRSRDPASRQMQPGLARGTGHIALPVSFRASQPFARE